MGKPPAVGLTFPGCHLYLRVSPVEDRLSPSVATDVDLRRHRWRFPACLARAVRGPERFRGGCSFGADIARDDDSPARVERRFSCARSVPVDAGTVRDPAWSFESAARSGDVAGVDRLDQRV